MKRVSGYALVVGLIGALKSFMLTPSHYEMMLRTRDPSEVLIPLRETVYQRVLPEAFEKTLDILDVERRLLTHYYEVFHKVLTATPQSAKPLLEAIYGKHELNCLKTIIRALARNVDPTSAFKMIAPVGRYDAYTCKRILATGSVPRVVEFVEEDLREAILSYMAVFRRTGSTVPIESVIDKYAITRIWDSLRRLDNYDRKIVARLIGIETDTVNIMTVLRAKRIGMEAIDIEGLIIPAYYWVTEDVLVQAARAPSLSEAMKRLAETPYKEIVPTLSEEAERALFTIEIEFKRRLALESTMVFQGSWFHVGILLGFLNLKFYEINDLVTIINGKAEGVDIRNIRKALILHQGGRL